MQSARAVGQAAIWKTEMETAGNQKDSFNISSLQIWYQTVDTSLLLLYGSWMFKQYVLTVCDWLWAINKIPESGFYNRAKKSVHLYYIVTLSWLTSYIDTTAFHSIYFLDQRRLSYRAVNVTVELQQYMALTS